MRELDAVAEILRGARSMLFITGAGVSADSGLPTYRGVGGLYEHDDAEEGIPIEVAVSGPMFRARPEVTWKHIINVERGCRGALPNKAHAVIARLEASDRRVWTLTQNVDGLHRKAGSKNLIEIHGDIHRLLCLGSGDRRAVTSYDGIGPALPPRCDRCGGIIRPEVVLFEEMLPLDAVDLLQNELQRGFDAVVSIGTTSGFPYIAGPVIEAAEAGVPTIEINPGATTVSALVDHRLRMRAAEAMAVLEAKIFRS